MPKSVRAFCPGKNPVEVAPHRGLDFILEIVDKCRLDKVLCICIRLKKKPNLPAVKVSVGQYCTALSDPLVIPVPAKWQCNMIGDYYSDRIRQRDNAVS